MKRLGILFFALCLGVTSSLYLSSSVYAQEIEDDWGAIFEQEYGIKKMSTTQVYFPQWITQKVEEGYDFSGIELYGKDNIAIHLQEELPGYLDYNMMNYYLLGNATTIDRIETDIYCPTPYLDVPKEKGKQLAIERLKLLEESLSKLVGIKIQLTEVERGKMAEHAVDRSAFIINKDQYKIEVVDYDTKTYNDYRPAGFDNIKLTLKDKAKLVLDKSLGTLPFEEEAMRVVKKVKMTTPQYSKKIDDILGSREILFKVTDVLPKDDQLKLYRFEVSNWLSQEEIADSVGKQDKPCYIATWAVKKEVFYDHFDENIAKIEKECMNVAETVGFNGKQSDLKEGLESARAWAIYRKSNPTAPAYSYQQHCFPEKMEQDDQYDFSLQVELNDDLEYVLVRIYL